MSHGRDIRTLASWFGAFNSDGDPSQTGLRGTTLVVIHLALTGNQKL